MRAAAWIGVIVVGWSLNIRWGDDEFLGNGPPATYHKHVVGAMLLAFVAALLISLSHKLPFKLAGCAAAVSAGILAVIIKTGAPATVTSGSGLLWMTIGAGLVVIGSGATLSLKPPEVKKKPRRKPGR